MTTQTATRTYNPVRFKAQKPMQPPSIQNLTQHVSVLTQLMRNPEHMDQLNMAAAYIQSQWEGMGLKVTIQPVEVGGRKFKNVMVSLGPEKAERFVVGAHYDVFEDQPGADDNASGVAGLLELTRLLKDNASKLKKRVDFVAYTLEEQPYCCVGSQRHVDMLREQGAKVSGMVSLEMIGYYSDQKGSQSFPSKFLNWIYPNTGNFIAAVGFGPAWRLMAPVWKAFRGNVKLPFQALYSPINAFGLNRSDHRYYAEAGIPALMITDTANHRNPNYHSTDDTIYTLNFDKMAEVVKGVYRLVAKVAA